MKYKIEHDIPGRIRLSFGRNGFAGQKADALCYVLSEKDFVREASVYPLAGSLLIYYKEPFRQVVLDTAESCLNKMDIEGFVVPAGTAATVNYAGSYVTKIAYMAVKRLLGRIYLPSSVRALLVIARAIPIIFRGIKYVCKRRRLNVEALDAAAIGLSIFKRDYSTAATVMFLLSVGSLLEEWTHKKSRDDLARGLAVKISSVWVRREGRESIISPEELKEGELVVSRMGSFIPVDGTVVQGEAMVNQSSMTGESAALRRVQGDTVYAGTVIEEGELVIQATALDSQTKLNKIIGMIDESERFKASVQSRIENMADAIVPYNFLLAGLVFLFTRNTSAASAALMVDYSCALKMSTPISILTAMREGARHGFIIKGGKFLEEVAEADTIVFDKTGTLTEAKPCVADIIPFGENTRDEVLRLSACLEEHFPHSVAAAVVEKAKDEELGHRETHAAVEYVVAHGIASYVDGKRAVIGSGHFVFDDEGVACTDAERDIINQKSEKYSLLFLAVDGRLAGMLCISDPIRPEAAEAVDRLKRLGIRSVVMLTGDSERAAQSAAAAIHADEYRSQVLPEDKAEYIKELRAQGRKVIMLGDGINDSPALSSANVGIAMKNGADIVREIADITLTVSNLNAIVELRILSMQLIKKIEKNFRVTVAFNSILLLLGIFGAISPGSSAFLHNFSTVSTCIQSMRISGSTPL